MDKTDDSSEERWAVIPGAVNGYGHTYSASTYGRIRNDRTGKRLAPVVRINSNGYTHSSVWVGGERRHMERVGRIILRTFVGPCPTPKHQCCHRNGRSLDNRLENLRWDTQKGNEADKSPEARERTATAASLRNRGEGARLAKLREFQIPEIVRRLRTHEPMRSIANDYGVSISAIYCIKTGKTWKHLNRPALKE
jgi:hypothetical protein